MVELIEPVVTASSLTHAFFLIFTGAAVLATLSLITRQPMIIAYIVLGVIIGPYGLKLIDDTRIMADAAEIVIMFLLFLLVLDMLPHNLIDTRKSSTLTALVSCIVFFSLGYLLAQLIGFSATECLIIGAAMMFSSTIIGIKLLPTTVLHHKHTGELVIGLLLLQDILAIIVLLTLDSLGTSAQTASALSYVKLIAGFPSLGVLAWLLVNYLLLPLIRRYDRFHEYIFLLAIGWCLGIAQLAHLLGLSAQIGAFIAGVALASSPISLFIANHLRPLRDFFLILFFFSVGAGLDLTVLPQVVVPATITAAIMLLVKPVTFRLLLHRLSESTHLAWDVGARLGQVSEFSLLIAYLALSHGLLSVQAGVFIQTTTIITFVCSSYWIVLKFPNPMAIANHLRRD